MLLPLHIFDKFLSSLNRVRFKFFNDNIECYMIISWILDNVRIPVLSYANLTTWIWSYMSIWTIEIVKYRFLIKFGVQWYVTRLYLTKLKFWRFSGGTEKYPFRHVQFAGFCRWPTRVKFIFSWSLYPDASFKMVTGLNEYLTAPPTLRDVAPT